MNILITGAAGMIGRKLTARLVAERVLNDKPIDHLKLLDVAPPPRPDKFSTHAEAIAGRYRRSGHRTRRHRGPPGCDLPSRRGGIRRSRTRFRERRARQLRRRPRASRCHSDRRPRLLPRVVFSSSIAVFGAPFPDTIPDDFALTPLTSYGTQKAMVELMLADYTRRGFIDGVGIRLPNIVVRPGKPNKAASGFFSSIIREPLNGEEAVLPVEESVRNWHASPRAAVGFLVHAAGLMAKPGAAHQPYDARLFVHRCRADRVIAKDRGRQSRVAHPLRPRPARSTDRGGLAGPL